VQPLNLYFKLKVAEEEDQVLEAVDDLLILASKSKMQKLPMECELLPRNKL
jgi:hypothetical protein